MGFYFDSLGELLRMDGHGLYVWSCYGVTWAVLVYLGVSPGVRRRRWLRRQRALLRRAGASRNQNGAQEVQS